MRETGARRSRPSESTETPSLSPSRKSRAPSIRKNWGCAAKRGSAAKHTSAAIFRVWRRSIEPPGWEMVGSALYGYREQPGAGEREGCDEVVVPDRGGPDRHHAGLAAAEHRQHRRRERLHVLAPHNRSGIGAHQARVEVVVPAQAVDRPYELVEVARGERLTHLALLQARHRPGVGDEQRIVAVASAGWHAQRDRLGPGLAPVGTQQALDPDRRTRADPNRSLP